MLYTTTRSNFETGTAQRALRELSAPDGGFYVPMVLPKYTPEQIAALQEQSPAATVAQIMNAFFSCRLTELDVEFLLGKNLAKLVSISHRITVAECWRNREGDFSRVVRLLTERIAVSKQEASPGEWMQIVTRIVWPLLKGTHFSLSIISAISALKIFDLVYLITGGGPFHATEMPSTYMYDKAFNVYEQGYASAVATIIIIFALIVTFIQLSLSAERKDR